MANDYIETLKERDKAKPLVKADVIVRADGKPHGNCPECGYPILFSTFKFCPICGQRFDLENWAL